MYNCIACLLGVVLKYYDDVFDMKLDVHPFFTELAKSFIVYLTMILSMKYFPFLLITTFALVTSFFCKGLDNEFWVSYMFVVCFVFLIFIHKIAFLLKNPFLHFVLIMYLPIFGCIESFVFNEETSKYKLQARANSVVINTIISLLLENIIGVGKLKYFNKIIFFINSYFLMNIFMVVNFHK